PASPRPRRLLRLRAAGPGFGRSHAQPRRPRLGRGGAAADRGGGRRPLHRLGGDADGPSSRHPGDQRPLARGRPACTAGGDDMNADWGARYELAVLTARRAGLLALGYFDSRPGVEWKADQSPVTVADREAEQLLRTALLGAFPDDGFLGEEFGEK